MSQFSYIVNANPASFVQQHLHPQQQQIHLAPSQHHQQQRGIQHQASEHHKPLVRGKTSPYGFFVKMCYEEHKKKYPNERVQVTEISKKCSIKWKTMSEDEKRRFFELSQKDAERYQAEVAAYGGDDVVKRKRRAKKDVNAPKRALSAFFVFSNECRAEVQKSHPEWKVGQIAQELGRSWKAMSDVEKQNYEKKAAEDKARYSEEMNAYRISIGKPPLNTPSTLQPPQQQQPQSAQQNHQRPEELPMQVLEPM